MAKNVAGAAGACYSDAGVSLAIGNTNAVEQYFDARFDIYNQDPPLASPSADPPAVNVRKGYLPGHKSNAVDWCSATPASGSNLYYTYPSDRTVGAATQNSPALTDVANTIGITAGEPVVDSAGAVTSTADNPATVSGSSGSTVTLSSPASETQASDGLTIEWTTSGLPEDISFPNLAGAEGNGQWDCANYWAINHPHGPSATTVGTALGGVCGTPAQTTVSRYQVYRHEISLGASAGGTSDWSGRNGWASNGQPDPQGSRSPAGHFQTESGAPFCASARGVSGVDTIDRGRRSAQSDRAAHQLSRSNGSRRHHRRWRVLARPLWPLSASSS